MFAFVIDRLTETLNYFLNKVLKNVLMRILIQFA